MLQIYGNLLPWLVWRVADNASQDENRSFCAHFIAPPHFSGCVQSVAGFLADGLFWFISFSGLEKLDLTSREIETIGFPSTIKKIEHLIVLENEVWVNPEHNPGRGLYIYDLTSETWSNINQSNSSLQFNWLRNLEKFGRYILMPSFGPVELSKRQRGDQSMIVVDGSWVHDRYGLDVYDIENDAWMFFTSEDGMLDGEIWHMHKDNNSIWFSNGKTGIWRMDLEQFP